MARLVLGILAVCVLWWCWLVFSGGPAAPDEVAGAPGAPGAQAGPSPEAQKQQLPIVPARGAADTGRTAKAPRAKPEALAREPLAKVEQQEPVSQRPASVPLRADFRSLRDASGDSRAAIAQKLLQRATQAQGVPALLQVLGKNNAFLHSPEGQKVARRTLVLLLREPPEKAVAYGTQLLNRCMRGAIGPDDKAAKQLVDEIYQRYRPLVRRVVFDPTRLDGARRHLVGSGESLGRIAAQARKQGILVDADTLALVNRVSNPNLVKEGQLLKIPVRPIRAVLEKRSFLMALYLGDVMIRLYWVGHGADDRTPETTFTVGAKLKHPDWYADDGKVYPYGDPKNVLGDYFVKFNHASFTGFGAHGTPDPATIGQMASKGCIRMLDTDIREFYRVMPVGCEVEIRATE